MLTRNDYAKKRAKKTQRDWKQKNVVFSYEVFIRFKCVTLTCCSYLIRTTDHMHSILYVVIANIPANCAYGVHGST